MARPKKVTTPEVEFAEEKEVVKEEVVINPIPETKSSSPEIINVYSIRYQLWHPFQKRMIPVNEPVPVINDSWLKSQMVAGHIKELK